MLDEKLIIKLSNCAVAGPWNYLSSSSQNTDRWMATMWVQGAGTQVFHYQNNNVIITVRGTWVWAAQRVSGVTACCVIICGETEHQGGTRHIYRREAPGHSSLHHNLYQRRGQREKIEQGSGINAAGRYWAKCQCLPTILGNLECTLTGMFWCEDSRARISEWKDRK